MTLQDAPTRAAAAAEPAGESDPSNRTDAGRAAERPPRPRAWVGLALTLLPWASAFAAIKVGLEGYAPQHLALLRFLTASSIIAVYTLFRPVRLPAARDWPLFLAAAAFGIPIYHVSLNYAEQHVSAGVAGLLLATSPVMAALLAAGLLRERVGAWGWAGTLVCFAGAALIVLGGEADGAGGWRLAPEPRAGWVLLSSLGGAVYTVAQKRALKRYSATEFTACSIWVGTAALMWFAPGFVSALRTAPTSATLAGLYLGVFPTALSYLAWAYVGSAMSVSRAVSFLYLVPGLALLIAWAWLGEVPTWLAVAGGALVVCGVVLINSRASRAKPGAAA